MENSRIAKHSLDCSNEIVVSNDVVMLLRKRLLPRSKSAFPADCEPYNTPVSEGEGKAFIVATVKEDEEYVNKIIIYFELDNDKICYLREYADGGAVAA
jgi:hypothetical protein